MFLEKWAVFPSLTSLRSGLAEAESWSNHVVPVSTADPILPLHKGKTKTHNHTGKKQV